MADRTTSDPPAVAFQEAAPADPLVGTTLLDKYFIEKKLGEGGMGAVYLARHIVLEKQIALKILHPEYSSKAELVERFLHEAKAAARIRHEHVIDITDFGKTASGNVFFAMELLSGRDLADELKALEAPLPWPRARSIMLQLCSAVQAAHEHGVIHRDLKPENIYLINRLGNPEFVKVLDFGIAKLTELEETGRRLTRTGMVFGTPEYMSPEQAKGERPDARVDVYAAGCLLYELMTGQVPYRADTFMGVLTKHLFEPVPSLLERTARDDLPPGLEQVIAKTLAKDKDKRFASMNELAAAIAALDDNSAAAIPVAHVAPPLPQSEAPPRSRRFLAVVAGLVAVGGAAVAIIAFQPPKAPPAAAPPVKADVAASPRPEPTIPDPAAVPAAVPAEAVVPDEPAKPVLEPAQPEPVSQVPAAKDPAPTVKKPAVRKPPRGVTDPALKKPDAIKQDPPDGKPPSSDLKNPFGKK